MNEDVKDAIWLLKLCIIRKTPLPEEALSWIKIVIDYTEKLQKENEELQYKLKEHISFEGHKHFEELKRNTISKDIIRDKIKEYKANIEVFKKLDMKELISITENKILGLVELLEWSDKEWI